tara:strand:+ start:1204 stop:1389 length:186 start_codon:yes stop_codon:yes gene_type:complete
MKGYLMINMIQCNTLGGKSNTWIVYRDGKEVFRGSRKRCFNLIHRGNPSVDSPQPSVKEVI